MVEIMGKLFVCNQDDFNQIEIENGEYSLCLCSKTFHKIVVGELNEKGNVCNKHPEYLIANRPEQHMVALNLIDAPSIDYIKSEIIDRALEFIKDELAQGRKVLIVCDQGKSRSACIGLMYILDCGMLQGYNSFLQIEQAYLEIYNNYDPNKGMREYTSNYFYNLREQKLKLKGI